MKKLFLIPVLLLVAGELLAQAIFVGDAADMFVQSKILLYAGGELDNHGHIELNVPFKNAGENNFILRYNGEI